MLQYSYFVSLLWSSEAQNTALSNSTWPFSSPTTGHHKNWSWIMCTKFDAEFVLRGYQVITSSVNLHPLKGSFTWKFNLAFFRHNNNSRIMFWFKCWFDCWPQEIFQQNTNWAVRAQRFHCAKRPSWRSPNLRGSKGLRAREGTRPRSSLKTTKRAAISFQKKGKHNRDNYKIYDLYMIFEKHVSKNHPKLWYLNFL